MQKLSVDEFNEKVRNSKGDIFVDFFAEWCGPCKSMEPVLGAVAEDETVYQVDIDEAPELVSEFEIMSIPCVILFRDGEEYKRSVGGTSEKKIRSLKQ